MFAGVSVFLSAEEERIFEKMAENIKVVVRIRPPHSFPSLDGLVYGKTGEVDSQGRDLVELRGPLALEETNGGEACAVYIQNRHGNRSEFVFDTVFDSSQQKHFRGGGDVAKKRNSSGQLGQRRRLDSSSYGGSADPLHGGVDAPGHSIEDDEGRREGGVSSRLCFSSSAASSSSGLECNSQEAVFERTTKPLCDSLLEGFNATILAYGQTGVSGAGLSICVFFHTDG